MRGLLYCACMVSAIPAELKKLYAFGRHGIKSI